MIKLRTSYERTNDFVKEGVPYEFIIMPDVTRLLF